MPVLASDTLVSVPIPMNVVQSVIPISAALIIIAEVTYLIDLVTARTARGTALDTSLSDGLH